MPDIKFILENKDLVLEGLKKKGYTKEDLDIDELIGLHKKITALKICFIFFYILFYNIIL